MLLHLGLTDTGAANVANALFLLAVAIFVLGVAQIVAACLRWWLRS